MQERMNYKQELVNEYNKYVQELAKWQNENHSTDNEILIGIIKKIQAEILSIDIVIAKEDLKSQEEQKTL